MCVISFVDDWWYEYQSVYDISVCKPLLSFIYNFMRGDKIMLKQMGDYVLDKGNASIAIEQ